MSTTVILEVSEGAGSRDIKNALKGIVHSKYSESLKGFSVFLDNTNVSMSVKTDLENASVFAENLENAKWSVGLRVYFDVTPILPNPFDDIKKIIQNLFCNTAFEFVLSYQYETIYAKRDVGGLTISDEF